jgi:hypothetical protein
VFLAFQRQASRARMHAVRCFSRKGGSGLRPELKTPLSAGSSVAGWLKCASRQTD